MQRKLAINILNVKELINISMSLYVVHGALSCMEYPELMMVRSRIDVVTTKHN